MANKTCGECKHFNPLSGTCIKYGRQMAKTNTICAGHPTNGDKIRQGGSRALADFAFAVEMRRCNFCAYFAQQEALCQRPNDKLCSDGLGEWLNAPAEARWGDE